MNPRVAVIVAAGLLISSVSFAAGPTGQVNPADAEGPLARASAVTCAFPGNLAVFTVNKADQSVHAAFPVCEYDLTGTVKRAKPRRVKALNLDGGVSSGTPCCETMHIDSMKYSKRKGIGKMTHSFVCGGRQGDTLLNTAMTCQ